MTDTLPVTKISRIVNWRHNATYDDNGWMTFEAYLAIIANKAEVHVDLLADTVGSLKEYELCAA